MFPNPIIEPYDGIDVVRDDILPGGTKSRYLYQLFEVYSTVVYATPAYGGAQVALAACARIMGGQAVLFVAKRKQPHPRTIQASKAGAIVYQVPHGYLSHVQSKAHQYCTNTGAFYLEFGADMPQAIDSIANAARVIPDIYDEVWCAAGSGVLSRGLQKHFTRASLHAVQVGRSPNVGKATLHISPLKYEAELKRPAPFPSCPNYDRKAWDMCIKHSRGKVLFWNVLG